MAGNNNDAVGLICGLIGLLLIGSLAGGVVGFEIGHDKGVKDGVSAHAAGEYELVERPDGTKVWERKEVLR